jgi:hypothetical protein
MSTKRKAEDQGGPAEASQDEQSNKRVKTGSKMAPARKQAKSARDFGADSTHAEYNVWYGKYNGTLGRQHDVRGLKALTRCDTKKDGGYTKADIIGDSVGPKSGYACIFFARGCCQYGVECQYYHRVPTVDEVKRIDILHDVFGRDKFSTDAEDMSGVGNFNRDCRTLYVGRIVMPKLSPADAADLSTEQLKQEQVERMTEQLARHFSEWGPIEYISVKPRFPCAFISFYHRCHAEFAMVAMNNQGLDKDENLNLRWAFEDPNPKAKARTQAEKEEAMGQAILKREMEIARRQQAVAEQESASSSSSSTPLTAEQKQEAAAEAYRIQYAEWERQHGAAYRAQQAQAQAAQRAALEVQRQHLLQKDVQAANTPNYNMMMPPRN